MVFQNWLLRDTYTQTTKQDPVTASLKMPFVHMVLDASIYILNYLISRENTENILKRHVEITKYPYLYIPVKSYLKIS